MAARSNRKNRRAAPYPLRRPTGTPSFSKFTPSFPKFTPVNAPPKNAVPPVGGPKTPQGGLDRDEALRQTPIGTSTVRMLVGESTAQEVVPKSRSNTGEVSAIPPTPYDVDPTESAYGVPTREDLHYWNRAASSFIRSSSGIDPTWVGRRPLGQGSFGIAGVWEKFDHNGNVVDTVVIKQIGVRAKDLVRGIPWESGMPHEVRIMSELNETNCDNIVKIRSYKRYLRQQIHRIYLEYCPYGDLRKLYKRYRQFRRYLPEPYLWETFRHLLQAVAAMHFGPIDAATGQRKWGYEIVHRDLKPQNVFLGNEGPLDSNFPFYPTAKVGDFGLAERTNANDANNPRNLQGAGTRIYMAPEQKIRRGPVPLYLADGRGRLGHETNLWAVGATMYELLTLHHAYSALYSEEVDEEGEGLPVIRTTRIPEYSAELRTMIRMCLRPDPSTRPDFEQLAADVDRRVAELTRTSRQLRGRNLSEVHQSERVYYRGNEINSMSIGDWAPTDPYILDPVDESGFKDPFITEMRFPVWNRRANGPNDEEDEWSMEVNSSQSDPNQDVKRIWADRLLAAAGAAPPVRDDGSMKTDGNNNNDDTEGGDEDEEEATTEIPAQMPAPPRQDKLWPNANRFNKFGRPRLAW